MVSLAGASAAYGGYQRAREADNQIDLGDINVQNARTDQEADKYLGNAARLFQQSMPGAQPMGGPPGGGQPPMPAPPQASPTPQPGQPSVPMSPPVGPMQGGGYMGQPGAVPTQSFTRANPSGAPTGMQPPAAAPAQGQPPGVEQALAQSPLAGRLDLKTLMAAITQANPGGRPEVIARALTKAIPLMNAQAQMDWKQMMMADRTQRTGIAADRADIAADESARKREQGGQRLEQGQQRIDQQAGELASRAQRRQDQTAQGAQRIDLATQREARQAAQAQIRQDQRWQQLEVQKQQAEQRIQQAGDRGAISQWRAIVDAQHKRAMEIIQSSNINANLSAPDKKALLDEQNQFYADQIKQMRDRSGNSTGRPAVAEQGGKPGQAKTEERVPAAGGPAPGAPVKVTTPQEAQALPPGTKYVTPDGQTYTR